MKRRSFLGSLVALVCAPFVPKVAPAPAKLIFGPEVLMMDLRGLFNPPPEVAAWMDRERYAPFHDLAADVKTLSGWIDEDCMRHAYDHMK